MIRGVRGAWVSTVKVRVVIRLLFPAGSIALAVRFAIPSPWAGQALTMVFSVVCVAVGWVAVRRLPPHDRRPALWFTVAWTIFFLAMFAAYDDGGLVGDPGELTALLGHRPTTWAERVRAAADAGAAG